MTVLLELRAAARCIRLAAGLPVLWGFSRREGHRLLLSVDEHVMPVVHRWVSDPDDRAWIRAAFRTAAIKFGVGVWAYTKMAGRPVNFALIALSTAFTRLYDDLIDHAPDDGLDDRFDELLRGGCPAPMDELEQVLYDLFQA